MFSSGSWKCSVLPSVERLHLSLALEEQDRLSGSWRLHHRLALLRRPLMRIASAIVTTANVLTLQTLTLRSQPARDYTRAAP
jgi:hypothetical protein